MSELGHERRFYDVRCIVRYPQLRTFTILSRARWKAMSAGTPKADKSSMR
jgi:hypothetical protein